MKIKLVSKMIFKIKVIKLVSKMIFKYKQNVLHYWLSQLVLWRRRQNLLSKNIYLSIGSCFWNVLFHSCSLNSYGQSCQEQHTFETIKQCIAYLHLCLLPYTLVVPIKFCSQCSLKYLIITSLSYFFYKHTQRSTVGSKRLATTH